MIIIGILLSCVITFCLTYFFYNPKRIKIEKFNEETRRINDETKKELQENYNKLASTQKDYNELIQKYNQDKSELDKELQNKKDAMLQILNAEQINVKKDFEEDIEKWKQEYLQIGQENVILFNDVVQEQNLRLEELNFSILEKENQLKNLQSAAAAAIAAMKRKAASEEQKDFYRLQISELDIQEIKKIREIEPYLRDSTPLNKVIYKCYYENAYTSLIGRVLGNENHCGIYKITNIQNGMSYVGQARSVSERWKQHIKKGIGADTPNNNKLYPAMKEIGVENFTFELLEECDPERLDEREDWWQDYYKCKEYGYSIK